MIEPLIASDHGGFKLKRYLQAAVELRSGQKMQDLGAWAAAVAVDYPDYAARLATAMAADCGAVGLLICRSGIGMSIAVNRYSWIRGALCHDEDEVIKAREHNDANVLILAADSPSWQGLDSDMVESSSELVAEVERRVAAADPGLGKLLRMYDLFVTTAFCGERHQFRVDKLGKMPQCL